MKFRKKPIIIEAIKFDSNDLSKMINAWGPDFSSKVIEQLVDTYMIIYTLEGNHEGAALFCPSRFGIYRKQA